MGKIIIGITGPNGSGKTALAEALNQREGVLHLGMRALLNQALASEGKPSNRDNQHELANRWRAERGPYALAERQLALAQASDADIVVVESIRSWNEVLFVRQKLYDSPDQFLLVSVDAPFVTRIRRMREIRKGENDQDSVLGFLEKENAELFGHPDRQRFVDCMRLADIALRIPDDEGGELREALIDDLLEVIQEGRARSLISRFHLFVHGAQRNPSGFWGLMPVEKLEVFNGQPYECVHMGGVTAQEMEYWCAQSNIKIPCMQEGIEILLDNTAILFMQPEHMWSFDSRYLIKDGMTGKVRPIGQKEVIPPGVLIAYECPW